MFILITHFFAENRTEDGITKVEVTFDQDTVWLSIDQMSELFQRDKSVIGKHIRNIFKEGELVKEAVWAKFACTASDGKTYQVDFYNLDVIISVGYRVKSLRGTQFRIWASNILKEYMKKGFALDDERLKNLGGGNYFDELLSRIYHHPVKWVIMILIMADQRLQRHYMPVLNRQHPISHFPA